MWNHSPFVFLLLTTSPNWQISVSYDHYGSDVHCCEEELFQQWKDPSKQRLHAGRGPGTGVRMAGSVISRLFTESMFQW